LSDSDSYFYLGNDLEGRARDFLRLHLHLPVKPIQRLVVSTEPETYALVLGFSWDTRQGPLHAARAQFVDGSGVLVADVGATLLGNNPYISFWRLDSDRTNSGTYHLKLRRIRSQAEGANSAATNVAYIADVEIGNLAATQLPHLRFERHGW
jgi:hypothetical protein